jgi:predicted dehydrogenase
MSKIGVGVIGASPLRPGWAVTAHLPALLALSEYEYALLRPQARRRRKPPARPMVSRLTPIRPR